MSEDSDSGSETEVPVQPVEDLKPAWVDVEDELLDEDCVGLQKVPRRAKPGATFDSRLVDKFHLVHGPTPSWAVVDEKARKRKVAKSSADEELEGQVPQVRSSTLTRGDLKVFRVLDLNNESRDSGAIIRSVGFHPMQQVGLVAGNGGVVNLFQVDGVRNTKIQAIAFDRFPLSKASFSTDGGEIYASSAKLGHFYSYDMLSGKILKVKPSRATEKETIRNLVASPDQKILVALGHHGNMYLYSTSSKEVIETLTMTGDVTDVAFNSSGSVMYSTGSDSEVFKWDMNTRSCVGKFRDHGAVTSTKIAASDSFVASGSNAGVVNMYQNSNSVTDIPSVKPQKAFMNLVTPVSVLDFSTSGELLAMGSSDKVNALKLVHVSSLSVYSQFPQLNMDLGRINSFAFSPNSGYFSLGNNKGTAMLFRLKHYQTY